MIRACSDSETIKYYERAVEEVGLWPSERAVFCQYLNPSDAILDLGCGAGRTTIALRRRGFSRIRGIDLSIAMVKAAYKVSCKLRVPVQFDVGDICDLPYADHSFENAIFSANGLMQIPGATNRLRALTEVARVLTPGGRFIFTTPYRVTNHSFWKQQRVVWNEQRQDTRLHEFGDVIVRGTGWKEGYVHFPTVLEVRQLLARGQLRVIGYMNRAEVCREPDTVDQFARSCIFWITQTKN